MSPVGLGTKNHCASEGKQQFTLPDSQSPGEAPRAVRARARVRVRVRVMSPLGLGTKNHCASEDKQQFNSWAVARPIGNTNCWNMQHSECECHWNAEYPCSIIVYADCICNCSCSGTTHKPFLNEITAKCSSEPPKADDGLVNGLTNPGQLSRGNHTRWSLDGSTSCIYSSRVQSSQSLSGDVKGNGSGWEREFLLMTVTLKWFVASWGPLRVEERGQPKSSHKNVFMVIVVNDDRLCGLVVSVSGYRSTDLGFDSRPTRFCEK
jgi:hypothetical protein